MLIYTEFINYGIPGIIGILLGIIFGITVHEFSHAWMANRLGDPTPKQMGRVSLNPLRHLDVFGTILIFLVGIGWGKPVVYNPDYLRHGKKDELKIALAGPISNIIVAFIFALPYRIFILFHLNLSLTNAPFFVIAGIVTEICLILAVFNILPIPPLDGSKIIFAFVSEQARMSLEKIGPPILIALIAFSFIFRINIFGFILLIVQWLAHFLRTFP